MERAVAGGAAWVSVADGELLDRSMTAPSR